MRAKTLVVLLSLSPAACGDAPDGGPDRPTSSHGDAIVGGEIDHGHDGVALLHRDPGFICTGTMIDDRVLLTAAHCIESVTPGDYNVVGGTDLSGDDDPDYYLAVDEVHRHPGYDDVSLDNDVAVVLLAEDSPVEPYRWLAEDPGDIYESGTEYTSVGYGEDDDGDSAVKRRVEIEIAEVYATEFLGGDATGTICFGDSGGPAVVEIDGYYTVIGVHSYIVAGNCEDYGGMMRTDAHAAFIENYASPFAGTAEPGDDSSGGGGRRTSCSVASVPAAGAVSDPVPLASFALAIVLAAARRRRAG